MCLTVRISDKDFLDIVKDLDKSCKVCMIYKRPRSRPMVVFSLAHDFNKTAAKDLNLGVYIFCNW